MTEYVISSQEAADIITHDGNVKEWNQKTYEWINNMFIGYDTKWRWIYEWLGISYHAADGSIQDGVWANQPLRHRDMEPYESSRNVILKNAVDDLQAQLDAMMNRIIPPAQQ